VVLIMVLPSLR